MTGKSIWFTHPAEIQLGIGVLHSRISDLRNKNKISIQDKPKVLSYADRKPMNVKEYFMEQEDIEQYKQIYKQEN